MKYMSVSLLLLLSIFLLSSCQRKTVLKPDTPENTVWLFKRSVDDGKYDNLKQLFTDEGKNTISLDTFNKIRKISTPGASFINYQLLTFTNGEMVLVRLSPNKINGEYKIEDVIIVPKEAKKVFMDNK
ncbi:MAG: hypothetical protein N2486_09510 [Caloramator sp.]|nr:hypothetical protein [Caloramator sp.]